jgi:multidrug resistance efflux pump
MSNDDYQRKIDKARLELAEATTALARAKRGAVLAIEMNVKETMDEANGKLRRASLAVELARAKLQRLEEQKPK